MLALLQDWNLLRQRDELCKMRSFLPPALHQVCLVNKPNSEVLQVRVPKVIHLTLREQIYNPKAQEVGLGCSQI